MMIEYMNKTKVADALIIYLPFVRLCDCFSATDLALCKSNPLITYIQENSKHRWNSQVND